jgi:hypothetical protein
MLVLRPAIAWDGRSRRRCGMTKRLLTGLIVLAVFALWTGLFTRLLKPRPRLVGENPYQRFAFSPDGAFLYSNAPVHHSFDEVVHLWDGVTGMRIEEFRYFEFSPKGKFFISLYQGKLELREVPSFEYVLGEPTKTSVEDYHISPTDRYASLRRTDGFSMFDLGTRSALFSVNAPFVNAIHFSQDEKHFIAALKNSTDGTAQWGVQVCRTSDGTVVTKCPRFWYPYAFIYLANDLRAAVTQEFDGLHFWRLPDWELLFVLSEKFGRNGHSVSPRLVDNRLGIFMPSTGIRTLDKLFLLDPTRPKETLTQLESTRIDVSLDFNLALVMKENSAHVLRLPACEEHVTLPIEKFGVEEDPNAIGKAEVGRWYFRKSAFVPQQPLLLLETVQAIPPEAKSRAMEQIVGWLNPAYALPVDPGPRTVMNWLDKELRLFDINTGAVLFRFPPCDEWTVSPTGQQLVLRRGTQVQFWDLPPPRPWPLILLMAFLHTLLVLAPCWYFNWRS